MHEHGCCSKEGHEGHDHHKDKHGHKKELWHAMHDENMPADERIGKLEELKDHLVKKVDKITATIDELKKK